MKRCLIWILMLCLLLSGCGWMDGSYVYVVPHEEQSTDVHDGMVSAGNYTELMTVMEGLVSSGTEDCVINVSRYIRGDVKKDMETVCRYILEMYPMGAYAVEEVSYEVGTNSGRPAIAVTIGYRCSRMEIQQIKKYSQMDDVEEAVQQALADNTSKMVLQVNWFAEMDFSQVVREYAMNHPQIVMEIPHVSTGVYGTGLSRIVELNFSYQNSREALRQMQVLVRPVFEAAVLYVSGEGTEHQKLAQLSSFLTERFDYQLETSITPSYSLLCHGVGDSRAFAEVYASMCRRAGLECYIVTGSRSGEPWTWNMVKDGEYYYHVDLVGSNMDGEFYEFADEEMEGYVWDYSAYPACETVYEQPEEKEEGAVPPPQPDAPDTPAANPTPEESMPEETLPGGQIPEESQPTLPEGDTEPTQPVPPETAPQESAPAETEPTLPAVTEE